MSFETIILVKSPLQYINALEACYHYSIPTDEALLILMADKKSRKQLDRLAKRDVEWGKVLRLHETPAVRLGSLGGLLSHKVLNPVKLSRLAMALKPVRRVLVGDVDNYLMRHFVNSLPSEKIIILDDGTKTLHSYKMRAKARPAGGARPGLKRECKRFLFGLKDDDIGAATFFTNFELDALPGDTIERNSFDYLKERIKSTDRTDAIYFIGGALVEAQELSESEYMAQLEMIREHLKGERVTYVAHRRESQQKLLRIKEMCGWDICLFDFPIEYQIAAVGPVPERLISFTSTALLNCNQLFGEHLKVVSYRFSTDHFSNQENDKGVRLLNIYEYFEANKGHNFEILALDELRSELNRGENLK